MFKELLSIFRGHTPLAEISENFRTMLELVRGMTLEASELYWQTSPSFERIQELDLEDIKVNKLERTIRKQITTHLSLTPAQDVPYCLLLMSLVKDVERLGDYATNLAEASVLVEVPIPEDPLTIELRDIRGWIESLADEAARVFANSDRERATDLVVAGRSTGKRCDELIRQLAKSDYPTGLAVKLTLGTRFYKRIGGHYLNLLSSVIMPLHKLDYYDQDALLARKESD